MSNQRKNARERAAKDFADKWTGRGYKKGDTSSFWRELLRDVIGVEDDTTNVRFENRTSERGFIDVVIRDAKTVVGQRSLGVDLDKAEMRQGVAATPFGQAKRYADSLHDSERPDTIIICDFDRFPILDLGTESSERNYTSFHLAELPERLHLLDFLLDPQRVRQWRKTQVSLDAGALIGTHHHTLRGQHVAPNSKASIHSLCLLCVRLVFLLFAEDAGLFPKNAFNYYLEPVPVDRARAALKELFAYLNDKPEERDPYAAGTPKAIPYVNGGRFAANMEVPQLTQEAVDVLLDEVSEGTDWSQFSPAPTLGRRLGARATTGARHYRETPPPPVRVQRPPPPQTHGRRARASPDEPDSAGPRPEDGPVPAGRADRRRRPARSVATKTSA